ncbi:hypothetical protein KKG56_03590, partial [bacterium]|nr:hypothetical protein [bacterium]
MYRLLLRIVAAWLMVVCWWGLHLLDSFQPYKAGIAQSLMWLFPLAIILLVISSWQRRNIKGQVARVGQGLIESQTFSIFHFPFSISLIFLALLLASACITLSAGYPTFCSSFLCPQVSFVVNLFGFNSGAAEGTVLLDGKSVLLDAVKVGLWQILAFTLVFSGLVLLARIPWHKRLRLIIIGIVCHYLYLIAYAVWMVVFIPKEMLPGMGLFDSFWGMKMWMGFLPVLPLWFWLMYRVGRTMPANVEPSSLRKGGDDTPPAVGAGPRACPLSEIPAFAGMTTSAVHHACFLSLILLLAFSISMSCFFFGFSREGGKEQETVILIDEIHSRWESTLREFNRQEFGMMAENNYHMFLEYISHFHKTFVVTDDSQNSSVKGVITLHEKALSKKLFDSFQGKRVILILKCFTKYPTDEEMNITVDFVKRGGNILFIGDHTDVFFMDTYINKISKRFGIEFVPNAVYVPTGGWPVTDRRNMRYHPVTQHMDRFVWATSDVLRLSGKAAKGAAQFPLILSPLASYTDKANYFNDYFFGDTMFKPDNSMGIHAIMAAAEYGKGKVVAWSDSTCFNNEIMFTVDRRGLLHGVFNWFSHSGYINPFPTVVVVILIILVWYLLRFRISLNWLLSLWLILGIMAGLMTAIGLNNILYPSQKPQIPLPDRVLFDESHQPANPLTMGNMDQMLGENSYERFFYHLGRCKYYPEINYSHRLTKESLTNDPDMGTTTCLIIVTPRSGFSIKETRDVAAFVKNGAGLLLIEGAGFDKTTINEMAAQFGLHFRRDPHTLPGLDKTFLINPTLVEGGKS